MAKARSAPIELIDAGVVRTNADADYPRRLREISSDLANLSQAHAGGGTHLLVVVEEWWQRARPPSEKSKQRDMRHVPVLGAACAAAMLAPYRGMFRLVSVPSDVWPWRGVPGRYFKDALGVKQYDEHKERRVAYAAQLTCRDVEDFGATSIAGNVADATLLAAWGKQLCPGAEVVMGVDPSIQCTGYAFVRGDADRVAWLEADPDELPLMKSALLEEMQRSCR